jgi:hypothetical protein
VAKTPLLKDDEIEWPMIQQDYSATT